MDFATQSTLQEETMKRLLNDLDRILRGEATHLGVLREENLKLPLGGLLLGILLLAVLYGVCMGFFAGFREGGPFFMQWFADAVKVPALFFLTLAVTFPSLYVFNALVGSRLSFAALFQLLVAALAVNVAVLASLGPIVAFFSVSTTSYPFILLLNVLVFVVSGGLGFAFLLQTLYRLTAARHAPVPPAPQPDGPQDTHLSQCEQLQPASGGQLTPAAARRAEETGALWGVKGHVLDRHVKAVFISWMLVFGLVTAQMAWVLRPFLGKPAEPFQWFCVRESSFFQAVWDAFRALLL
jgi:hypothetical protein